MWDHPNDRLRCLSTRLCRSHKRCWFIKTAGRWPWKLESAKECVTTHLPNELALKMDGAKASYRDLSIVLICKSRPPKSVSLRKRQCVGGRGGCIEADGVTQGG